MRERMHAMTTTKTPGRDAEKEFFELVVKLKDLTCSGERDIQYVSKILEIIVNEENFARMLIRGDASEYE